MSLINITGDSSLPDPERLAALEEADEMIILAGSQASFGDGQLWEERAIAVRRQIPVYLLLKRGVEVPPDFREGLHVLREFRWSTDAQLCHRAAMIQQHMQQRAQAEEDPP